MEKKMKSIPSIINSLPKKYRAKAFSLLRYIARNNNISWNDDYSFKYRNKNIANSNIIHLVLHALLKSVKDKPPGMKIFYEALSDVNTPQRLIANEMGKLIITGKGGEVK